jgi:putative spermidine/putrescine transport system ATP-binding protein
VADFVGLSNRLPGTITGGAVEVLGTRLPLIDPAAAGPSVTALVRPEAIDVTPDAGGTGKVLTSSFLGPTSRVTVTVGDQVIVAQVASGLLPSLTPGTPVRVTLHPVAVALVS